MWFSVSNCDFSFATLPYHDVFSKCDFSYDAWCQFGGENNIGILFLRLSFYGHCKAFHMMISQNCIFSKLAPSIINVAKLRSQFERDNAWCQFGGEKMVFVFGMKLLSTWQAISHA